MTPEQRAEYNEMMKLKMRQRRASAAQNKPQKPNRGPQPRNSAEQVVDNIRLIMDGLKLNMSETHELYDVDMVSGFLNSKYKNLSTLKTKYSSLVSFIRDTPEEDPHSERAKDRQHALKVYRDRMYELAKQIADKTAKNEKSDRDQAQWADWSVIKGIKASDIENPIDRLTYLLYTEVPPRRREFYSLEVLLNPGAKAFSDTKRYPGNYVVLSSSGNTIKNIVLRNYKTSNEKGQYNIKLTYDLRKALEAVLWKDEGENKILVDGQNIWPEHLRSPSQWTLHVQRVFGKFTGKKTGVNALRKSYVSSNLPESEAEQKELGKDMGTSVKQLNTAYLKKD